MANKLIVLLPENPVKFVIPIDPDLLPDFPDQEEIAIILTEKTATTLDVYQKDLVDELKGLEFEGKVVHWLNNFGMKRKGAKEFEQIVDPYNLEMNAINGAIYVYYDGKKVLELPTSKSETGKVSATLNLGDPPAGWVK